MNEQLLAYISYDAIKTCDGDVVSHKLPMRMKARLTADGVNPRSRRVLEKSDEENCFLWGLGIGVRRQVARGGGGEDTVPRELLSKRDGVNIHRQTLTRNKLCHLSQS